MMQKNNVCVIILWNSCKCIPIGDFLLLYWGPPACPEYIISYITP
jgi:hypothetical protein